MMPYITYMGPTAVVIGIAFLILIGVFSSIDSITKSG